MDATFFDWRQSLREAYRQDASERLHELSRRYSALDVRWDIIGAAEHECLRHLLECVERSIPTDAERQVAAERLELESLGRPGASPAGYRGPVSDCAPPLSRPEARS